jgi:PEP-CTERM motif
VVAPAAHAGFLNPFSSNVGVVNPDTNRNTNGTGPIADSASSAFGLSTVDVSAAVNATGLHVSGVAHADSSTPSYAASGAAYAGMADPFMLVPQAGFLGTQVLLQIPYSFGGSIDLFPSVFDCSSCFGDVNASLGVDGMSDGFSFSGVASQGTMASPAFMLGGVSRSGVLQGLVPVNTELYLRSSMIIRLLCQSDSTHSCTVDVLFGGSLSYTAASPDPVDFVWGLQPQLEQAGAPEPAALFLFGGGLIGLAALLKLRRKAA